MQESESILDAIRGALDLRSHKDLFRWLQDEVQEVLPHDVLIASWGDFESGEIFLDVVSCLPGMRTTDIDRQALSPFLAELFGIWTDLERAPFAAPVNDGISRILSGAGETGPAGAMARMRSAVAHGIKDERGWHDCLYIALNRDPAAKPETVRSMELLLPYIDAAFRQVTHLPIQLHAAGKEATEKAEEASGEADIPKGDEIGLSAREQEIMRWVSIGKTNPEIGLILDISPSTVRNHLQRVFRKLDVTNRTQAVLQLERAGFGRDDQ